MHPLKPLTAGYISKPEDSGGHIEGSNDNCERVNLDRLKSQADEMPPS